MQFTESKTKRSRKSAEESNTAAPQAPVAAAEETSKPRRKAPAKKAAAEATPAAKQHRGAAKKSVVSAPEAASQTAALDDKLAIPARREITHADIASLAYSYWAARGYQGGSPEEDWFRAEKQLSSGQ